MNENVHTHHILNSYQLVYSSLIFIFDNNIKKENNTFFKGGVASFWYITILNDFIKQFK